MFPLDELRSAVRKMTGGRRTDHKTARQIILGIPSFQGGYPSKHRVEFCSVAELSPTSARRLVLMAHVLSIIE